MTGRSNRSARNLPITPVTIDGRLAAGASGIPDPSSSFLRNVGPSRLAKACHRCYNGDMKSRTAAEEYFSARRADPEYGEAYATAVRRVQMFDEVIRSLDTRRGELGLSKAELARRAGMPPAAVRRLFSQQHKNPTLSSLVALADALSMDLRAVSPRSSTPPVSISNQVPSRASGTRRRTA
jgi:DNA-binding phage protein